MVLPCELIDEVLCRLPVKYLLRFRCVSKGWCSLIDSNAFVKKHLKRALECNAGGGSIFINSGGDKFYLADLESLDDDEAVAVEIKGSLKTRLSGAVVVGAANGLVCVSKNMMNQILVINPSTRRWRKIASAPAEFPRCFHSTEVSFCGFGYDDVNDDYKVVKIADCHDRGMMIIVYSLKTNSWKWIQNVPRNVDFCGYWGMFAGGALHWLATKDPNASEIVVGFDLALEQFKEIPYLVVETPTVPATGVVSDGGSLWVLEYYPDSHMDMWMMNNHSGMENENLWFKALSVEQHFVLGSFSLLKPVAFSKSGESVLLEVHISVVDRAELVWYDLKSKTVKNVKIQGIPHNFESYAYTESLVQLSKNKLLQRPSLDKPENKHHENRDDVLSKGFKLSL
ncbi:hypothetical protein ACET3Z_004077 [Daucus carota]